MSLNRVVCPSCNAGLKSTAGFTVGQKLRCPKCQNAFAVPEPAVEVLDGDEEKTIPNRPTAKKPEPPKSDVKKKPIAAVVDDDEDSPGARKPKRAAAIVDDEDDDDADDDRPRKKKKKKQGGYKNSPLRYAILGVLLVILGYRIERWWASRPLG